MRVTNAYNIPDIGDVSGETTPYKTLQLFEGFASGVQIEVLPLMLVDNLVLQDQVRLNIIKVHWVQQMQNINYFFLIYRCLQK